MTLYQKALRAGVTLVVFQGCAEGPLWKTGRFSPWARERWQAEEQRTETLFARKDKLEDMVRRANQGNADPNEVAQQLATVAGSDPILLIRLHAVKMLGKLEGEASLAPIQQASKDPEPEVRICAVGALASRPASVAVPILQEVLGSDTHVDVRLAATRALGSYSGKAATDALALALSDNSPAIQLTATESLEKVTGQKFGPQVQSWQNWIASRNHMAEPDRMAREGTTPDKTTR